jgi:hypothetical protein
MFDMQGRVKALMELPAASGVVSNNLFIMYVMPDLIRHPAVVYRFRLSPE